MTVRPAVQEDTPQIVALVRSILGGEFPQDQAAYATDDLEHFTQTYGGTGSTFLVAEKDGRIVGTLGIKAEGARTAVLRRLFVDPQQRRHGIGSKLFDEALAFCRQQKYREVIIRTSTRMEKAIRLCLSKGFGEDDRWQLADVTLIRYRLKL
ncbi:MAG: hypothetical protein COV76_05790 [Candidatus Omnitrophica bacterium CG11_big_fil_rev_8_21_14_0_20_64_10]|nr:MAG: hypothetical protein COV76_05790 [Candidatus Omnitrophica bacterium CG11_big_fil_rev_8_21_14_0_20_64_10]